MTYAAMLQDLVGPGKRFPNARQLSLYLEVNPTMVGDWLKAKRSPRGGLPAMLEIAERLGLDRDEAMRRIAEPESTSPASVSVEEVLERDAAMPPDVRARFMRLDRDNPAVMEAAWRAAIGVMEAITRSTQSPEDTQVDS